MNESRPTGLISRLLRALLLPGLLFLVSCEKKVPLYSDLREHEANEIMSVLMDKDVPCGKIIGKEEKWALEVSAEDFSFAMQTLQALGLPHQGYQRMGEIFQKSGLVSSPTEERIRFIYALSQELQETFTNIDGVVSARVHIALPDTDPLGEKGSPASAAVFIKYRQGYNIETLTPDLKSLVTKSVEGLNADNVQIVLSPAETAPPPKKPVKETKDAGPLAKLPPWAVPAGAGVAGFIVAGILFSGMRRKPKPATA